MRCGHLCGVLIAGGWSRGRQIVEEGSKRAASSTKAENWQLSSSLTVSILETGNHNNLFGETGGSAKRGGIEQVFCAHRTQIPQICTCSASGGGDGSRQPAGNRLNLHNMRTGG
jgi:hypothetical protein